MVFVERPCVEKIFLLGRVDWLTYSQAGMTSGTNFRQFLQILGICVCVCVCVCVGGGGVGGGGHTARADIAARSLFVSSAFVMKWD